MKIIVNGIPREVAAGTTLKEILEEFRQKKALVVGELNGEIPPAEDRPLQEGDRVEVVTFVGGG